MESFAKLNQVWSYTQVSRQVAHDIQSPLGALRVAVSNLKTRPEVSLRVIHSAASRIEAIVSDLSSIHPTQITSRKAMSFVDMNHFVLDLIEEKWMEYNSLDSGSVEIEFLPSDETIIDLISPSKMARALSNIINNGVEASRTRPAKVWVRLYRHDNNTIIEVKDNGLGVPLEARASLFKSGYSYGKQSGQGRGLSYAQSVIEEHGGEIEFLRDQPEGTTVRVIFS